jgi:hypothetical protein
LRHYLSELARRSQIKANQDNQGDMPIYKFQKEIEVWFDRSQERNSGSYKRNTKRSFLIIGFLTALLANADAIHMTRSLYS